MDEWVVDDYASNGQFMSGNGREFFFSSCTPTLFYILCIAYYVFTYHVKFFFFIFRYYPCKYSIIYAGGRQTFKTTTPLENGVSRRYKVVFIISIRIKSYEIIVLTIVIFLAEPSRLLLHSSDFVPVVYLMKY